MLFLVCRNMLSHNGLRLPLNSHMCFLKPPVKDETTAKHESARVSVYRSSAWVTRAKNFKFVPSARPV
jgi:hypothetical protein